MRVAEDSGNWTEGLVTYLADYHFAVERGEGLLYRKNQLSRFQSYVHSDNSRSVMEFFGADFGLDEETLAMRAIGYDKVCMIFYMLNRQLGDKAFYEGLREFIKTTKYKRAGWEDLQRAFENTAKVSLTTFFDQWTKRSDVPRLRVDDLSYDYPNGVPELSFTLRQGNKKPYHLVVPLTLYFDGGTEKKILQIDAKEKRFGIPLSKIPHAMSIDPDYHLMRQLEDHEWPLVWSRFEGAVRKIVIVSDDQEKVFAPIVKQFKELGYPVKKASEATDTDAASGAVLFLGVDSPLVRSLFAKVDLPADGFTIKVRPHPLTVGQVAVLVSAASVDEVEKAAYKVRHYGNYSYLHFVGGRLQEKSQEKSEQGMLVTVDSPPVGIETKSTQFFKRVMDEVSGKRVVYVGEVHNAYEDHLLEFRIIRALYERDNRLAIGMEMFSRAAQPALDEYVAGKIDEKAMLEQTNYFKQWGFDYQFYREILQYARRHHIPVIGLNIKNEVANTVFRKGGLSALSAEQKKALPEDRDLDMPDYQDRILATFYMHGSGRGEFKDFFQVQALWDETMASSVAKYLADHPDTRMVVMAGREHVLKDNAIPPRVSRRIDVSQAIVVNGMRGDDDQSKCDFVFFAPPAQLPPPPMMGVRLDEKKKQNEVAIIEVVKNSPAAKAGIKKGDILVAMDDRKIKTIQDIKIAMLDKKRGDTVKIRVRRHRFLFGDQEIDLNLVL
ncbi:MAG: ChaN family lipoprotein [Deltaproteobacteria bacterium]